MCQTARSAFGREQGSSPSAVIPLLFHVGNPTCTSLRDCKGQPHQPNEIHERARGTRNMILRHPQYIPSIYIYISSIYTSIAYPQLVQLCVASMFQRESQHHLSTSGLSTGQGLPPDSTRCPPALSGYRATGLPTYFKRQRYFNGLLCLRLNTKKRHY